jgi:hypothetical protein
MAHLFYRGTPKHYSVVKCPPDLFFVSLAKAKMARNAAFISLLEREGLSAAEIGASYILNMYQNTIY